VEPTEKGDGAVGRSDLDLSAGVIASSVDFAHQGVRLQNAYRTARLNCYAAADVIRCCRTVTASIEISARSNREFRRLVSNGSRSAVESAGDGEITRAEIDD